MGLITRVQAAERLGVVHYTWVGRQFKPYGPLETTRDEYGKKVIDECRLPELVALIKDPEKQRWAREYLRRWNEKQKTPANAELKPVEPVAQESVMYEEEMEPRKKVRKSAKDISEDDFDLFDDRGRIDPAACRAWQEFEKAKRLQAERYATEGRYVEVDQIQPAIDRAMQTIRKGVMAIPVKLKAVCHDLTVEQQSVLERLCRESLEKVVIEYGDQESK